MIKPPIPKYSFKIRDLTPQARTAHRGAPSKRLDQSASNWKTLKAQIGRLLNQQISADELWRLQMASAFIS